MSIFSNDSQDNKDYLPIRTESRFFNISRCPVLTDGVIADRDGLIPNAIWVSDDEVADYVGAAEERQRCLESIESFLEQWIDLRHSRSRKAKSGLSQLQRKGVVD